MFGHCSFLHSLVALLPITIVFGLPLWWIMGNLAPAVAIIVGYGSHLFADMMTLGGVRLFWLNWAIAAFPGRDEYCVVTGSGSERVFVAVALDLAGLFYPVSRMGFDGLLCRLGGADQVYGRVTKVTDGDTVSVEVYGLVQPVRLIGVATPETVAIGQPATLRTRSVCNRFSTAWKGRCWRSCWCSAARRAPDLLPSSVSSSGTT